MSTIKRKLRRNYYYFRGMDYINKKIEEDRQILNDDSIRKTNHEKWCNTIDDLFDIMTVCIWKLRDNYAALEDIHKRTMAIVNENVLLTL